MENYLVGYINYIIKREAIARLSTLEVDTNMVELEEVYYDADNCNKLITIINLLFGDDTTKINISITNKEIVYKETIDNEEKYFIIYL